MKGPSAATLYGTDAANGVIVVTTKRGRAGARALDAVSARAARSTTATPTRRPTRLWGKRPGETVSSRGVLQPAARRHRRVRGRLVERRSTSSTTPTLTPLGTGSRSQYGAQVSGGTDAVRYFVGADGEKEIGVLDLPQFERAALRLGGHVHSRVDGPAERARQGVGPHEPERHAASRRSTSACRRTSSTSPQRYSLESNSTAGLGSQVFGGPGTRNNGTVSGLGHAAQRLPRVDAGLLVAGEDRPGGQPVHLVGAGELAPVRWLANRVTVGSDCTGRNDENLLYRGEGPPLTRDDAPRLARHQPRVHPQRDRRPRLDGAVQLRRAGAQDDGRRAVHRLQVHQRRHGRQPARAGLAERRRRARSRSATRRRRRRRRSARSSSRASPARDRLFLTAAVRSDQNSAFGTNFQRVFYPKASAVVPDLRRAVVAGAGLRQLDAPALRLRAVGRAARVRSTRCSTTPPRTTSVQNADLPAVIPAALGNPDLKPERSARARDGLRGAAVRRAPQPRRHVLQQADARRAHRRHPAAVVRRRSRRSSATSAR